MRIKVNKVSDGWKPDNAGADFKPIYTLYADGYGSPIKTQDEELAMMGVHEVEEYQSKSGKQYFRLAKNAPKTEHKSDFNEGAAYGVALHAASRLVASLSKNTMVSIQDLQDQTLHVAQYLFDNRPDGKPKVIEPLPEPQYPNREGDTKDLPPIENYDENPVNLDEIPF